MPARSRPGEELVDARRGFDQLGLGRPTATHRDDDHVPAARERARHMPGDRGLPHSLAGPDHGERRQPERLEGGRVEAEVGTDVGQPSGERVRGEPEAGGWVHHGLVRQVDDDLRRVPRQRLLDARYERHAVILSPTQLLPSAREQRANELVGQLGQRIAHDRGVVLAVDDSQSAGQRDESSPSIFAVYFSYSSVSVENWMIRSCPWKGYRRHTETCVPSTSITL